ncbi:MAG: hypothetical protein ACJ8AW_04325 [Rhodopila sp.]
MRDTPALPSEGNTASVAASSKFRLHLAVLRTQQALGGNVGHILIHSNLSNIITLPVI